MSSTLVRRSCAVALPAHDTGCLGFCDLVFRGLSGTAVTGDPPMDALTKPVASCDAAFSCLLQLGGRAAGYGAGEVQFRNVVNGETLSISRLIELADELGIKAEHVQPDWHSLQTPGFSYPTLAVLKNANVVVLTGVGRGEGSEVAVWDPLNPHEEILSVPRADFERAWTGHALIITARASSRAVISRSSDFCWFTSAGLELLGKPPAKGRNPEASSHDDKEAGTRSTARRGRTRRYAAANAAATSAGPALARSEIVKGLPPAAFADGTPLATPPPLRRAAERKLSLPARSCIAAGVLIAVAGGAFLLSNSATDPVAAALALANEVWAVAPSIAPSNEHAPPNDSARIAQSARPTGAAPIPAPLPATSASDTGATPPAAAPAIKTRKAEWHAESTAASAGVAPATPSAEPTAASAGVGPATPSAEPTAASAGVAPATPSAEPTVPSAGVAPPTPSAGPTPPSAEAAPATPPAEPTASGLAAPPATLPAEPTAPSARVMPVVPLVAGGAPGPAAAPAAPSPAPSAMELDSKTAAPPAATNGSSLSADEMAALLARGDMLLSVGDVASARLFYERAADAGGGLAAIRLGETFDPLFLDRVRLSGVRGDPAVAASWYRRARDLGATGAAVLLKALEAKQK